MQLLAGLHRGFVPVAPGEEDDASPEEQAAKPVTVLARGQAGMIERYAVPAGVAGLAALLLAAE